MIPEWKYAAERRIEFPNHTLVQCRRLRQHLKKHLKPFLFYGEGKYVILKFAQYKPSDESKIAITKARNEEFAMKTCSFIQKELEIKSQPIKITKYINQ